MTTRKTSQNPLVLERRLGFWFKQGISRPTKTDRPFIGPPLDQLSAHIKRLNKTWGFESTESIRHSPALKHEIDRIFHQLAPTLWPDQPARRQALWLVDAQGTTHNGLYPKDLFASDPNDRRTLLDIFTLLVRAKLIKKRLNNDRDARLHGAVLDEEVSARKRHRPRRRKGSFSASPSSTSELTEFTESDSDYVDDMAAPQADMYHTSRVSVPPAVHPDIGRDVNSNHARNSQSRTSGVFTPQSNTYMSGTTSGMTSRKRDSMDELGPPKKHKTGGFGTSTPTQSPPPPPLNGTRPSSQPRHNAARPDSSREATTAKAHAAGPQPSNPLPTPRQSASYPASRKGSRKQVWDHTTPAPADADTDDKDDDETSAPSLSAAALLQDVRCFFDMSLLTPFRGMSCTPLLNIPDARTLFADIDRRIALAPPAQPSRIAIGVSITVYNPRHGSGGESAMGDLVYSPFIGRSSPVQSTFPMFVEDLAEWIARGEVSRKLWLLITVDWQE